VELANYDDYAAAMRRNREYMGSRYIELLAATHNDMLAANPTDFFARVDCTCSWLIALARPC